MRTIEIDFDVHKKIESERRSFEDPPNAVLRRLLGLGEATDSAEASQEIGHVVREGVTQASAGVAPRTDYGWRGKGVTLPTGTRVLVRYSEVEEEGCVTGGHLTFSGEAYNSPSRAAMAVVQRHRHGRLVNINGWRHIYARVAGESEWKSLDHLRSLGRSRAT